MLGSWLRPKPPQHESDSETDEWREEKPTHRPKYRSLVTDPNAPHNALLADLQGQSSDPEASGNGNKDRKAQSLPAKPETLLDPATGQLLGVLQPPESDFPATLSRVAEENEELWSHLSAVLDLQAQIARKHLDMETPGVADRKKRQSSKPGPWDDKRRTFMTPNSNSASPKMTEMLAGTTESEDPSMKVEGEEDVEARTREEEFSNLAGHFEGRKDAIDDIMGQVFESSIVVQCL